jgi:hypothetical protein
MAFPAIRTEPVFMDIPVTGGTVGEGNSLEFLHHPAFDVFRLVALGTSHVLMLPKQRKPGSVVVEARCSLEGTETVTGGAIGGHAALMMILVTVQAGSLQTHKGGCTLPATGILDKCRTVTGIAIQLGMPALQFKTGFPVVEFLPFKPNQLEIQTVVFVVAGETFLPTDLGSRVITFSGRNLSPYLLMAIQAFGPCHLMSQIVAFGAVAHAFQTGMCLGQIPGRDLRRHSGTGQDQAEQYHNAFDFHAMNLVFVTIVSPVLPHTW